MQVSVEVVDGRRIKRLLMIGTIKKTIIMIIPNGNFSHCSKVFKNILGYSDLMENLTIQCVLCSFCQ